MKKAIYAALITASLFGASCSKDEQPPQNELPRVTITESTLLGEWELTSLEWISYTVAGKEDHRTSYNNTNPDDPRRSWIKFSSNKTYIHRSKDVGSVGIMLADVFPQTSGSWSLLDGNASIKIEAKQWKATKFANNQMQIEYNETESNGTKSKIILLFDKY